jgi:hypothetical protein
MKRVTLVRPLRKTTTYVKQEATKTLPAATEKKQVSVEQVIALAQQLNPSERKELLARLALESQTLPPEQQRDVDMWAAAVYDALSAAIGGGGEGLQGPLVVRRILAVPAAWGPVQSFMRASKMDALSVTERQSVYMLLARLVVDAARYVSRTQHVPMGVKLVASCSSNITGIFGQSFPGYLESDLAPMIAKMLRGR